MAIPEANVNNTGSLAKFLEAIKTAGIPERITFEFIKTLGFKSSNDRPVISVMKAIGFLDSSGKPTERYKAYRSSDGGKVLAAALQNAYEDIFLANTKAQTLSLDKLKGIIASKTTKNDATVERIARTFQVLAKAAEFSSPSQPAQEDGSPETAKAPESSESQPEDQNAPLRGKSPAFHYNIEIHLPTTTDITVYNAIFRSLKENLL